jgi:hypothetical protein
MTRNPFVYLVAGINVALSQHNLLRADAPNDETMSRLALGLGWLGGLLFSSL